MPASNDALSKKPPLVRRPVLALVAFLGLTARAPGLQAPAVSIDHAGIGCAAVGRFVEVETRLAPPAAVAQARVLFRGENSEHWYFTSLTADPKNPGRYVGHIPKPLASLKTFEYYVAATDTAFGEARTPDRRVNVVQGGGCANGLLGRSAETIATRLVVTALSGGAALPAGFASTGLIAGTAAGATTAAAGAGGGGAGAGAAGAAAGGGISGTTLAIAGGVVAAGAGVAVAAGAGGGGDANSFDDYTGRFSGQLNVRSEFTTAQGGLNVCTYTYTLSGELTIKLRRNGSGSASLTGSSTETSVTGTCNSRSNATLPLSLRGEDTPVSGAPSAITFSYSSTPTPGPAAVTISTYRFTGSLSGNNINGTLSYDEAPAAGSNPRFTGTVSMPVTLIGPRP